MFVLAAVLAVSCGPASVAPAVAVPAGLPANVAVASELLAAGGGPPQVGEEAPDFRFSMQDGSVQTLSGLRGRTVLVNFWATWCAPCKAEMPDLQQIADEQGERVTVVGVNRLEALEAIGPFAAEMSLRFTLVPDQSGQIADRYGAKNLPMTYFINSDGTVAFVQLGMMTYEQATEQIALLR
jgi:thiol-disulfide isomerase/thioredoxin